MIFKMIFVFCTLIPVFPALFVQQAVAQPTDHGATLSVQAQPVTETVVSLKKMLLNTTQNIESVRIVHRGEYTHPELDQANAFFQTTLFAKAPYCLFYDSAHGHDYMNWQLDPFRQIAYVQKDHVFNYYPLDRMFFRQTLKPEDPLPGSLQRGFFFLATGLWPTSGRQPPRLGSVPYILRDIAQSQDSHLDLRPQLEKIGDRWCHVLEHPTVDAMWLDAERGGALVQRELYAKKTGHPVKRYRLLNQEQFAPGVWLPRVIENTSFEQNALSDKAASDKSSGDQAAGDKDGPPVQETTSIIRLIEIEINQINDSDFDYQIPPGSLEMNEQNVNEQPQQVVPGGLDQFDVMASWIFGDRISTITVSHSDGSASHGRSSTWFHTILPLFLIGSILLVCEVYLRSHKSTERA